MHGYAGLIGQPTPSVEQGNAMLDPLRPHVRLQVDVVRPTPRHQFQYRFEVIDAGRIALSLPYHSVPAQEVGDLGGESSIDEADAGTIETGVSDHRELGLQRQLRFISPPPLHRPERLQDAKLLRHGPRLAVALPPRASRHPTYDRP
jgi:hypothetical protein